MIRDYYFINRYYYDLELLFLLTAIYINVHEFSKTGKPKNIRHNIINNHFISMGVISNESSNLIIIFLKLQMLWSAH